LFLSLAMAATSPPPPPLARKREVGVVLGSFHSRWPPRHHHHPLSLANASWGCFLVRFPRDGRHFTTATPSRLQTRVGGGSCPVSLTTATTSPLSGQQRGETLHVAPTTRSGIGRLRDRRHVTSTTPPRSQTRGGGGSGFFSLRTTATSSPPPPLARKCELGVVLVYFLSISMAPPPSLASTARRRGFLWFCFTDHPTLAPNASGWDHVNISVF
jgi:hypothetical protein